MDRTRFTELGVSPSKLHPQTMQRPMPPQAGLQGGVYVPTSCTDGCVAAAAATAAAAASTAATAASTAAAAAAATAAMTSRPLRSAPISAKAASTPMLWVPAWTSDLSPRTTSSHQPPGRHEYRDDCHGHHRYWAPHWAVFDGLAQPGSTFNYSTPLLHPVFPQDAQQMDGWPPPIFPSKSRLGSDSVFSTATLPAMQSFFRHVQ